MQYARWSTKEEFKNVLERVNLETGVKKSGIPIMYDDQYLYIDSKESHNLLIGSTGSGKTQAVILPLLKISMFAGESIVINDPKGEIYESTARKLTEEGYRVIVIDFEDSRLGNSWNPLELPYKLYQEGNKDKAVELIDNLGYYIFTEENTKNTDPFWINSTINYFTGLVLYLMENARKEEINLTSVGNLANSLNQKENSEKFLEKISSHSNIYLKVSGTLKAPTETKGSIISVFNQKIERYLSKENLENMLSKSDFDISTISNQKTALFIVSGINSYCRNLIPLLADQIIESVSVYGNKEKRLNILLDEFDSLIPIKDFAKKLSYCRSINIRMTVTIQSFVHLSNMYSKEETEILKMSFGNILYLLSEDIYTLEEISRYCGNQMLEDKIVPLVTIEELKTLPVFEGIVIMTRMMPFKTKLLPDYKIDYGYIEEKETIPPRETNKICIYDFEK